VPKGMDSTFYRSPAAAIAAPPETLAYIAAFDPAAAQHDAMSVVDCDAGSATYGQVVGWAELPSAGNELHHFGWNACSSALCHKGHAHHGLERRYLVVPGLRSSRTYVLDTKPDPGSLGSSARSRRRNLPPRPATRARTPSTAGRAASSCPIWAARMGARGRAVWH
jgi:hypothetical protein